MLLGNISTSLGNLDFLDQNLLSWFPLGNLNLGTSGNGVISGLVQKGGGFGGQIPK